MNMQTLSIQAGEGFAIHRIPENAPEAVAVGSRLCRLPSGELLCTFMLQSRLGANDFKPVLSRSMDEGRTWSAPQPLWPDQGPYDSVFGSISPAPDAQGRLVFYGSRCPVDALGETTWQADGCRLKQNMLVFSTSADDGRTWTAAREIPKPTPGSVEPPGAMCLTADGQWICTYSVYNTFDRAIAAPHHELWSLRSADGGQSWQSSRVMQFGPQDGTAESWVVQLADGRLLAACWHVRQSDGHDYPNPYAISSDGGRTWSAPTELGIRGQSLALAAMPDGRLLVVYNQRRQSPQGVHLAVFEPTSQGVEMVQDKLIWQGAAIQAQATAGDALDNWTNFAFGEPSMLVLDDKRLLVALWCIQQNLRGIAGVHVQID